MRILFLSRWFPYPPDNGARIRTLNVLKQLAGAHDVSLVAFGERSRSADVESVRLLQTYCSSIRVVPYRGFRPLARRALAGLLAPQPRSLVDTWNPEFMAAALDEATRHAPDLLIASELDMIPYALGLKGVPALLEELEVGTYLDACRRTHPVGRARASLTWLKLSAYLRRALPRFDACTVVSEIERKYVQLAAPSYRPVRVLPNAVDVASYDGQFGVPQPNTLVFSGALTYWANYDAAAFLLREVFPLVASEVPDVRLRITGDHGSAAVRALPRHPGVELTGYVPDVRPVIAQSWLSLVPLRAGGGTRLKILESLALHTPVVSTQKGAEGLALTDGRHVVLANNAETFAERVVQLLRSPNDRARIATAGRQLVEVTYDWRVVGEQLRNLVTGIGNSQRERSVLS